MEHHNTEIDPALISFAIIKVNWDHRHNYIENFVPMVAVCLRSVPESDIPLPISLPDLQTAVTGRFGLSIPLAALKHILGYAAQQGYVEHKNKAYYRNVAKLATADVTETSADVERQIRALIGRLVDFTNERSIEMQKTCYRIQYGHLH